MGFDEFLREVDEAILRDFFRKENGFYILDQTILESVELRRHNIIHEELFSGMDIVSFRDPALSPFFLSGGHKKDKRNSK
jgi:chemotaxis methyl-accepting protein methylase